MAELAGEVVPERSGAHLGDGEAAGGDDEDGSAKFGGVRAENKFRSAANFGYASVENDLNLRGPAFAFEQIGDFRGRIVAEELAESFFVVGDAMLLDERDKIRGSVARQGGFGEMGIRGGEIFRRGVKVGEIATSAAGDKNLFADAVGVFDDCDAAATFACFKGAEEACGAGAED
jgi:hypothetical protein